MFNIGCVRGQQTSGVLTPHSDLDGIRATCQCWRGTIEIDCDREGVTCDELCRELE